MTRISNVLRNGLPEKNMLAVQADIVSFELTRIRSRFSVKNCRPGLYQRTQRVQEVSIMKRVGTFPISDFNKE